MSEIISVSVTDFPNKVPQSELKNFAKQIFSESFEDIARLMEIFDNSQIQTRNLCVPIEYFYIPNSFSERNRFYVSEVVKHSVIAAEECIRKAGVTKDEITDLVFVSTTGISTPSPDALIINKMKLRNDIKRIPVWGLGCAGGVAGIAKSFDITEAREDALVLLISAELCSLTFIKTDLTKSNLIATGLFSDGVAAVLISGKSKDKHEFSGQKIEIIDTASIFYYDTEELMGWEIIDEGFKVRFSRDIPSFVLQNAGKDISEFLSKHGLSAGDIKNFVTHPGGVKVLDAYASSMQIPKDLLNNSRDIMSEYGNMSSATVLYVLRRFMDRGFENGYGLMMSLGPGFSCEVVLLKISG